jgi:Domain of unknown function (DUF4157)
MKEFDSKKTDALPQPKLQDSSGDKKDDGETGLLLRNIGTQEGKSQAEGKAATLPGESLLHPANAERRAALLRQLQQHYGNTYVQRWVAGVSESPSSAAPQSEDGQSLDTATKAAMESAYGEDFSDVRTHTSSTAQEAAAELGARAFTRGRDIYFGAGEYDPTSRSGREVLAHELAHVVQQRKGEQSAAKTSHASHEQEAHEAGRRAAAGRPVQALQPAVASSVQRLQQDESTPSRQPDQPTPAPAAIPRPLIGARSIHITPAVAAAVECFRHDAAFEDRQVELYIAPESDRPRIIMNALMNLPAVRQEVLTQKPTSIELVDFLVAFGRAIWQGIRHPFLQAMDQRYQSDPAFRQKVDRARRGMEMSITVPPGGAVV